MIGQALKFLLDTAFGLLTYAFLLRFAMQWLRAPFRNPVGQALTAFTDWAVTVSPTQAVELRTPGGGFGLHHMFIALGERLVGILNGIDQQV